MHPYFQLWHLNNTKRHGKSSPPGWIYRYSTRVDFSCAGWWRWQRCAASSSVVGQPCVPVFVWRADACAVVCLCCCGVVPVVCFWPVVVFVRARGAFLVLCFLTFTVFMSCVRVILVFLHSHSHPYWKFVCVFHSKISFRSSDAGLLWWLCVCAVNFWFLPSLCVVRCILSFCCVCSICALSFVFLLCF